MTKIEKVENILFKLENYIREEDYKGWDPYDALNSKILNSLTSFNPFVQRIAIHLLKNTPFNPRELLGIQKGYNTKSISLFLDSYLNMYSIYQDEKYLNSAIQMKNIIYSIACINNDKELGWGRNYKYITTKEMHDPNKPLTFLNARLSLSLLNLYEIKKDPIILKDVKKAIFTIIQYGRVFHTEEGTFVGYSSDNRPRFIFNTSIITAELIIKYLFLSKQKEEKINNVNIRELAYKLIDTVLNKQEKDGKWYYGYNYDFTLLKNIDFHQGFVIDSLRTISLYDSYKQKEITYAYQKGLDFMYTKQINKDGSFKWRYPKYFPIDIHNQAQGIISLSKACEKKYESKFSQLLQYTIDEFFDEQKGYFYYQKNKFYKIKIPYMRWGEAWMFYALTEFIKNCGKKQ